MGTKNAKLKKKPQMPKGEFQEEPVVGEQLDLIDVAPENSKEIIDEAKKYKKWQNQRMRALEEETASKQKLLELMKKANLQRLDDGKLKISVDNYTITVTPRDELIKVKEKKRTRNKET